MFISDYFNTFAAQIQVWVSTNQIVIFIKDKKTMEETAVKIELGKTDLHKRKAGGSEVYFASPFSSAYFGMLVTRNAVAQLGHTNT